MRVRKVWTFGANGIGSGTRASRFVFWWRPRAWVLLVKIFEVGARRRRHGRSCSNFIVTIGAELSASKTLEKFDPRSSTYMSERSNGSTCTNTCRDGLFTLNRQFEVKNFRQGRRDLSQRITSHSATMLPHPRRGMNPLPSL